MDVIAYGVKFKIAMISQTGSKIIVTNYRLFEDNKMKVTTNTIMLENGDTLSIYNGAKKPKEKLKHFMDNKDDL